MVLFCTAEEFESLCRDFAGRARFVRMQVKGGSMYPFIRSGDWVELALCGIEGMVAGDIVLFRRHGSLYLHRLLRVSPSGLLAKGDMSFGCDGTIFPEDVIGKAVAVIRGRSRIDLYSWKNRVLAACAAASGLSLQYPLLWLRQAASLAVSVFVRLQGIKAYRFAARTVFPARIKVREAIPADEEALRDIYRMSGHDVREGMVRAGVRGLWLVAERNGRIIGGLTAFPHQPDAGLWLVSGLEVKPLFRGLGAGAGLVRGALERIKERGGTRAGLFVNKASRPALRLYRTIGFREDMTPGGANRSEDELYLSYGLDEQ